MSPRQNHSAKIGHETVARRRSSSVLAPTLSARDSCQETISSNSETLDFNFVLYSLNAILFGTVWKHLLTDMYCAKK